MGADEKAFLERWSRLKQAAREEPSSPAPAADPSSLAPAQGGQRPPETPETPEAERAPVEDAAQLPSIESLTAESDYTAFMRQGVPEELRQQALRKLWLTDAVFMAPDVLDIYALDYANAPTFPGGVKTLFQVGMGMIDPEEPTKREEAPATPDAVAESTTQNGNAPADSTAPESRDDGIQADTAIQNKPV